MCDYVRLCGLATLSVDEEYFINDPSAGKANV